jgi:hypothetical protein
MNEITGGPRPPILGEKESPKPPELGVGGLRYFYCWEREHVIRLKKNNLSQHNKGLSL